MPHRATAPDTDYKSLLESVRAIVWRADAYTFQTTFVSQEAEEILGYPVDSWIDTPGFWVDHVHPDDRARVLDFSARMTREGRTHDFEYRMLAADGRIVWLRNIVNVIIRDGHPVELIGITVDVSERRRVESEADQLRQELMLVGRAATVGELAATLAHEISQPLGAIVSNAETAHLMLQRAAPGGDARLHAVVEDIRADAARAADVINRIRTLLAQQPIAHRALEVAPLVGGVMRIARSILASHDIDVVVEVADGLPPVSGDAVQIQQVLVNLLRNAVDAMTAAPAGSRRLVVKAMQRDGFVELQVSDTGRGIADTIRQRMFAPFATTKSAGMGMGLAISRRIVQAHGGEIWAANNPAGRGATVGFTLPVYAAEHA